MTLGLFFDLLASMGMLLASELGSLLAIPGPVVAETSASGPSFGWLQYGLLIGAGLVAGTLNVLAGGGSFMTLPLLIFLGLPPGIANGTNRVGILLQNVSAVWSFHGDAVLDRKSLLWAAAPATLGAAIGTWLALEVSDDGFRRILAFLMVVVSLLSFWQPKRKAEGRKDDDGSPRRPGASADPPPASEKIAERLPAETAREAAGEVVEELGTPVRTWILASGFFAVGIYGGFVQAGVGFLILAVTSFAGLDLVRGNAVKVLTVLCFTALSLSIFALEGRVQWDLGLALASGTLLGGYLGARLTVAKGHAWVRGIVTVAVLVFAVRLWLG